MSSIKIKVLHVSTFLCPHQGVITMLCQVTYFFLIAAVENTIYKLRCFSSSWHKFSDCSCWNYKIIKMLKYCRFYNKIDYNIFGVTVSRAISRCLWLLIQSLLLMYYYAGLACKLSTISVTTSNRPCSEEQTILPCPTAHTDLIWN